MNKKYITEVGEPRIGYGIQPLDSGCGVACVHCKKPINQHFQYERRIMDISSLRCSHVGKIKYKYVKSVLCPDDRILIEGTVK